MIRDLFQQEDLNFLLTNRIPRRYATLLAARFSRIESRWLTRLSIAVWQFFAGDLALDEAESTEFRSVHECFVRQLRAGARRIDPDPDTVVSPCDAIVGACGSVRGIEVIQAKGFPYALGDLLLDPELVDRHRDGWFVTLRLRSNMYHRFHAPCECRVRRVTYISGDTWNVNPIALRRVEKLFCKNERAVIDLDLGHTEAAITMVPIAAILVAGIRIHAVDRPLDLACRRPQSFACEAHYLKGDEIGYFQSGSTIVVFASGPLALSEGVFEGAEIRVGERIFSGLIARTSNEERNVD
jgi:phosphatidylserine decarboxylase